MTIKEIDYKLAKDIARIRIAVNSVENLKQKSAVGNMPAAGSALIDLEQLPISTGTQQALKELNDKKDAQLIAELDQILAVKELLDQIKTVMTNKYIESTRDKLKIRMNIQKKSKPTTKFDAKDMADAASESPREIKKATDIIAAMYRQRQSRIFINASAAEVCGYDLDLLAAVLAQELRAAGSSDFQDKTLQLSINTFNEISGKTFERLDKQSYYENKWIYEKFLPIGIVNVKIT